jgi:hypothetical protein
MTAEFNKTSLIIIATIFTGFGGATLSTNTWVGIVSLLIAAGILVLRGWLEGKGIVAKK